MTNAAGAIWELWVAMTKHLEFRLGTLGRNDQVSWGVFGALRVLMTVSIKGFLTGPSGQGGAYLGGEPPFYKSRSKPDETCPDRREVSLGKSGSPTVTVLFEALGKFLYRLRLFPVAGPLLTPASVHFTL